MPELTYCAPWMPQRFTAAIEEGEAFKFNHTLPFSLTGWPCAVVRAGASPDGLPIGVQIVGGLWQEHVAVAAARRIEESLGGWSAGIGR